MVMNESCSDVFCLSEICLGFVVLECFYDVGFIFLFGDIFFFL